MRLLACPDCRRHYNATNLAPSARVRCRCGGDLDAALAVDRSAQTRAGSGCPACGAPLADGARCEPCGVELCARELHPLPPDAACPRCAGALRLRPLEHADLTECTACGGIWLEPQGFEAICRRAAENPVVRFEPATGAAGATAQASTALAAHIDCPRCEGGLMRRQFRHAGEASGVVVDVCADHGVWLDHRELEQIVAFVRAQDGGPAGPPEPAPVVRKRRARSRDDSASTGAAVALGAGELVIEALAVLVFGIFQ